MKNYDHKKIEKKWQLKWEKNKIYQAKNSKKKKFYGLIEFPYPSGAGLHVGHIRGDIAMDIISRKRRMEGYNVLYPIGWDAFGLPTENYAIKTGKKPAVVTKKNTDIFRKQLKEIGFSFDWSREINTTNPEFYKWTQWIFLQFFKKGLAYKAKSYINWCLSCKIGLANEEVVDGKCERCGCDTEKREKEQWMLAITKYAERLDKDLDLVDYPKRVKIQQRNWIGKSKGSEIEFKIKNCKGYKVENKKLDKFSTISVFTTRADTLFGATYIVLAPEHSLINNLKSEITNWNEVEKYIKRAKKKSEIERIKNDKNKTGVELKGIKAINPANNEEIPVWVADYVLLNYGTGAVMAVPAHDERDFEFANKYSLSVIEVVFPEGNIDSSLFKKYLIKKNNPKSFAKSHIEKFCSYTDYGILINSGKFDGLKSEEAQKKITEFVGGKIVTKFKLRDWVFSRQRYWGEPIPMIFCENCKKSSQINADKKQTNANINAGWFPVPEKNLPIKLPEIKNYKPTETGESPLASISKWINVKCPKCDGKAKRETDTMPNWAGSSWYYLRYTDSKNKNKFADFKKLKYWTPVDWYNGGMEHTTLHLLYSRFWHKFLYDLKLVPTIEPYQKRTSHGMILGKGGVKMSKSIGNVVNPDDIVKIYGADTLRIYEMFMGPFEESMTWSTESIIGSRRFIEKVWRIGEKVIIDYKLQIINGKKKPFLKNKQSEGKETSENHLQKFLHKTIKKVSEDIENMHFNTAISTMMIFINTVDTQTNAYFTQTVLEKKVVLNIEDWKLFLKLLAPFAPHITEELYNQLRITNYELRIKNTSIHLSDWPKWDDNLIKDNEIKIAVQVNGKFRAEILIRTDDKEEDVKKKALANQIIEKYIIDKKPKKIIYVKNRIINILI